MPNNVTLPKAAMDHMSQRAKDVIAEKAAHVVTEDVTVFRSTSANEQFLATDGADLFIFDVSTWQGSDVIVGYDPSEDHIEFHNAFGHSMHATLVNNKEDTLMHTRTPEGVPTGYVRVDDWTLAELTPYDSISWEVQPDLFGIFL